MWPLLIFFFFWLHAFNKEKNSQKWSNLHVIGWIKRKTKFLICPIFIFRVIDILVSWLAKSIDVITFSQSQVLLEKQLKIDSTCRCALLGWWREKSETWFFFLSSRLWFLRVNLTNLENVFLYWMHAIKIKKNIYFFRSGKMYMKEPQSAE